MRWKKVRNVRDTHTINPGFFTSPIGTMAYISYIIESVSDLDPSSEPSPSMSSLSHPSPSRSTSENSSSKLSHSIPAWTLDDTWTEASSCKPHIGKTCGMIDSLLCSELSLT